VLCFLLKASPLCCQGSSPKQFFHHRWLVGWCPGDRGLRGDSGSDGGCGNLGYNNLYEPGGARCGGDGRDIIRLSGARRCGVGAGRSRTRRSGDGGTGAGRSRTRRSGGDRDDDKCCSGEHDGYRGPDACAGSSLLQL